jgi:hypothetical protein
VARRRSNSAAGLFTRAPHVPKDFGHRSNAFKTSFSEAKPLKSPKNQPARECPRAADVPELSRACQSAQVSWLPDLSQLQSADNAGLEILRELVSKGAQIQNASPYIELLLKSYS